MATDLILPQGVDIEQDAYRTSQSLKNLSTETLPPSTVDGYVLELVGGVPTWVANPDELPPATVNGYILELVTGAPAWVVNNSSVQVVTAIGDATAFDGAQARVRAGSSPYQFVDLTYDSTYGKWVSAPVQVFGAPHFNFSWNNVSGSVAVQHHTGFIGVDCDAIYDDGGLRPQFMGGWTMSTSVSGSNVSAVGFQLYESNNNETGVPPGASISSTFMYAEVNDPTTWHEKHFDWVEITPTGTSKNGWSIRLLSKLTTSGTGWMWGVGIFMRWVSA